MPTAPASTADPLGAIEARVWRELRNACGDRSHGWRHLVLATRDGDGADARTVVLREADAAARTLLVFTDARSPKAAQIAASPRGTLVAWSPALTWQLRLRVSLAVQTEGLAVSSRWARLALSRAAQDYLAPLAPGSPLDAVGRTADAAAPPSGREGRTHFALVEARVEAIDWLELADTGHRRAAFDAAGARWLVP